MKKTITLLAERGLLKWLVELNVAQMALKLQKRRFGLVVVGWF